MKIKNIFSLIVLLQLAGSLYGCSTSSHVSRGVNLVPVENSVFVSDHYSGYAERHIGEVVRVLEKHGFIPTNNRTASQYYLDFSVEGGATLTVTIELLKDRQKIIDVESTNVWFGTVMFRPIAVANRVEAAVSEFDMALSKL